MNMKQNFFKTMLVALLSLFMYTGAYADMTSTLIFTEVCRGSGTADDGVEWIVESDGEESTFGGEKGIHYGTGSAEVTYIKLTTSDIQGTISKIVVNASTASKVTATVNVTVGGSAFGGDAQSLTSTATEYTFEGSASGEIIVTVQKPSKAKNALYVKSIAVTYTDSEQTQGTEDPQNSFANATENATVGEVYTVQEITTLSSGRKSYASSDETVATIDGSGNVTLKKAGETTITVTTAADETYASGSASYTLIVGKGTPALSFAQETVTAYLGAAQNGPKLNNSGDGAVTYEISNPDIATIQSNGSIQPIAEGTATVTATTAETDAWLSATASYTLIVETAFSIDAVGTYELVTDDATLKAGDQILISYIESSRVGKVFGTKQDNNFKATSLNYGAISADKSSFVIKAGDNATAAILEGSAGAWYFHVNDGYLFAAGGTSYNYLRTNTLDAAGNNAKASISISSSGDANIEFQGSSTHNLLKYNSQNLLFSCYNSSSNQKLVQIYRKIDTQVSESPLASIAVDGALTEFVVGAEFAFKGTVTATYEDGTTKDVTGQAEFTEPDMTTAGTKTVTVSYTEGGVTKEVTYEITVEELITETYTLVTDVDELAEGDKVIIVNTDYYKAMSTTQNTNNRAAVDVEIMYNEIQVPQSGEVQVFTLEGNADGWYFNTGSGYIYAASSTSNRLNTKDEKDDNAKATISIDNDWNTSATIQFQGIYSHDLLKYNKDNNLFSCYLSGQENVQIFKKKTTPDVDVTISAVGYATLYYSDRALKVPDGVTATTYSVADGKLAESKTYAAGKVIPAGEAVVLKGAAGDYKFKVTTTTGEADANSMLKGTDEAKETEGGNYYYALQAKKKDGTGGPGFYWMNSTGAAFTNGAHKAYMALDKKFSDTQAVGGAKSFYLFEEATGIHSAQADDEAVVGQRFNLSGQRVGSGYKGIVIVNGKKFMKK